MYNFFPVTQVRSESPSQEADGAENERNIQLHTSGHELRFWRGHFLITAWQKHNQCSPESASACVQQTKRSIHSYNHHHFPDTDGEEDNNCMCSTGSRQWRWSATNSITGIYNIFCGCKWHLFYIPQVIRSITITVTTHTFMSRYREDMYL